MVFHTYPLRLKGVQQGTSTLKGKGVPFIVFNVFIPLKKNNFSPEVNLMSSTHTTTLNGLRDRKEIPGEQCVKKGPRCSAPSGKHPPGANAADVIGRQLGSDSALLDPSSQAVSASHLLQGLQGCYDSLGTWDSSAL